VVLAARITDHGRQFTNGATKLCERDNRTDRSAVKEKKERKEKGYPSASVWLGVVQQCLIRRSLLQQLLLELSFSDHAFFDEELVRASTIARVDTIGSSRVTVLFLSFCHWAPYLITLSALASTLGGIVRPIRLAVFRFTTSSNFVGCSTGRSAGLAPLKILSTYVPARRYKSLAFTP
jgi:hypothetical protein